MSSVLGNIKSIITKRDIIFTCAQYEVNYIHICLVTYQPIYNRYQTWKCNHTNRCLECNYKSDGAWKLSALSRTLSTSIEVIFVSNRCHPLNTHFNEVYGGVKTGVTYLRYKVLFICVC